MRVLVAEDDAALRIVICARLRRAGYEVIEAGDGVECVGYGQPWSFRGQAVEPPDVIVSDVSMPGWSGLEALAILRSGAIPAPIILMTAFGSPEVHAQAARLGASYVLDKPFRVDDLVALVGELAALRRLVEADPPRR
ncbi:MAG: response regulator [Candidatus Binatia bacterium]